MFIVLQDIAHKLLSIFYFLIIKMIRPSSVYAGSKKLADNHKKSNTLYVLAPGQSISDYSTEDFDMIASADSIGINFFIFHEFNPTFYLIETHSPDKGYFKVLGTRGDMTIPILYKGYGSPSKAMQIVRNVYDVPCEVENFFIIKDAYIKNDWAKLSDGMREKVLAGSKSDYLYNYIASILYVVFMAYKMGYQSVVLCGFDMTDKYFYCEDANLYAEADKYGLCSSSSSNKIHSDSGRKENIIDVLCDMNDRFEKDRGGGVFVFSASMSLSEFLPVFKK